MSKRQAGPVQDGRRRTRNSRLSIPLLPEIDAHLDQIALISRILPKQYADEVPKEAEQPRLP